MFIKSKVGFHSNSYKLLRCIASSRNEFLLSSKYTFFRSQLREFTTFPSNKSEEQFNYAGVQLLDDHIRDKAFGKVSSFYSDPKISELSIKHLTQQGIYGKQKNQLIPPFKIDPPSLQGSNISDHFDKIGLQSSEPYLCLAKRLVDTSLPEKPKNWVYSAGWTQYCSDGTPCSVAFPPDEMLVFDVEVLVKRGPYPIIACAASPDFWYSWISPSFAKYIEGEQISTFEDLIPWNSKECIISVAHNASYDRARLASEYHLMATNTAFIDTMSLHVAVGGLSSLQRIKWLKYQKALLSEDESALLEEQKTGAFFDVSSVNSLKAVAQLYCKIDISKDLREIFVNGDLDDVKRELDSLLTYCADDVEATHKVYCQVFPKYLEKCPHPASFAGIITMGKGFLPCNETWPIYVSESEKIYNQVFSDIETKLNNLAEQALLMETPEDDPWLCHLDWTIIPLKMTKPKFKKDGTYAKGGEPRPYSNQSLPGKPMWYREYYDSKEKKIKVTIRSRVAPYLLKLKWLGFPVYYSKLYAWCYYIPNDDKANMDLTPLSFKTDPDDPKYEEFPIKSKHRFFKIPHKNGEESRCGNPLAKGYTTALESGTLSSEYPLAKQALMMNTLCAYWISARDRVKSQFVVWQSEKIKMGLPNRGKDTAEAMILPQITTMGTVTRRAVEATWMTASNAKKNRIGSELKSMIRAPEGYCIVGADVDSEELWISSLIGDAQFRHHGATAFGWMTLQGTKAEGTDMHSKTASILGISRGDAKVFNYGRIYGAGVGFATQLLLQFNPALTGEQADQRATQLYQATKGTKDRSGRYSDKSYWYGGSESFMFNRLEDIATSKNPRTPVLGCGIPNALLPESVGDSYLTSRVNWVVQSSGVDYLHLLIVGMDHLIRRFQIDARFMISVHDELRYLVAKPDAYRAALALQIANLWTRAMFAHRLGFASLPQSVAFFSAIDIDWILRKEVDMDCVTPSNPTPLAHGESYSIEQLLETPGLQLDKEMPSHPTLFHPRSLVDCGACSLGSKPLVSNMDFKFLCAQNATDMKEIKSIFQVKSKFPNSRYGSHKSHNKSYTYKSNKAPLGKPNHSSQVKSCLASTKKATSTPSVIPRVVSPMVVPRYDPPSNSSAWKSMVDRFRALPRSTSPS